MDTMTKMERVMNTLEGKPVDRVPVYPILSGVTRNLVGATYKKWATDAETCAEGLYQSVVQYDLDTVVTLIDLSVECDAWGQQLIWHELDAPHPDPNNLVIEDIEDYAKIKKVDYKQSKRMMMHIDVCDRLVKRLKGEVPVVAFVFGPMGTLSMLRNQEDMYMDLYDDPDAVKEAIEAVTETLYDYVNAVIDTGVSAVMFDTLFSSGSIMSKDMWKEMEGDCVKKLADLCHSRGVGVMIHNCGDKIYFDAQIEYLNPCAISCLYPPDDCKDFAEAKEKYGDKVTIIGCVPPQMVVLNKDEEWIDECKREIDIMGKGSRFMLATGCEYPSGSDFTKAKLMVDVAKSYYPFNK